MSNLITSYIRTYVPILVGALISWLIRQNVDAEGIDQAEIVAWLTPACIGAYYFLARLLERQWPALGLLLGSTKRPVYVKPDADLSAVASGGSVTVDVPPAPLTKDDVRSVVAEVLATLSEQRPTKAPAKRARKVTKRAESGQGNIATLCWFLLVILLVIIVARALGVS